MTEHQEVSNDSNPLKYFAIVPYIAIDDLPVFPFRLYCYYIRRCGMHNGFEESTRSTAKRSGISLGMVSETRKWLHDNGWIVATQDPKTSMFHISICDRWVDNMGRYHRSHSEQGRSHSEHNIYIEEDIESKEKPPAAEATPPTLDQVLNDIQSTPNVLAPLVSLARYKFPDQVNGSAYSVLGRQLNILTGQKKGDPIVASARRDGAARLARLIDSVPNDVGDFVAYLAGAVQRTRTDSATYASTEWNS